MDTNPSDSLQHQAPRDETPPIGDTASIDSIALFARFVDGDARAADALFQRYADRLIALARSRLSKKLAARVAPDDIVMSAYRSFFVKARDGRFDVTQPGAVWRLLVQITLHKLYRQVAHHQAGRRSIDREALGGVAHVHQLLSQEPSPDAAAELADEIERWMSHLSLEQRQSVEMRLQGAEIADVAAALGRSIKTVRRHLEAAKQILLGLHNEQGPTRRRPPRDNKPRQKAGPSRIRTDAIPGVTNIRFEDYLLEQQIGSGMTGKVYRAKHHQTGQSLAVKYLKKTFLRNPSILAQFLSEARIVAGLHHEEIIRLHGLGRTPGGGYFIAMDLALNGDLEQHVCRNNVHPRDLVRWLCQAADALHFAHEQGVVHCDLKPSNLLLNSALNLIVTDFGFARQLALLPTSPEFFAGTPAFMAPEQVEPTWGRISPLTDIYGLGTVIYFLLFGRPPLAAASVPELLAATAANRPIEFPAVDSPQVPEELLTICQDCLAKEPSRRISTMSELATRLRSLLLPQ